jgi:hypothetical protein
MLDGDYDVLGGGDEPFERGDNAIGTRWQVDDVEAAASGVDCCVTTEPSIAPLWLHPTAA